MRAAVAVSQESLLSIGDVLGLLKQDFPDVTISKIRFLESEGLVLPQRTASGYRKFAPADVQRLRYILGMQRDQYLPLRVIKDHLDAIDRGLQPPTAIGQPPRPLVSMDSLVRAEDFSASKPVRMTRAEIAEAAGVELSVVGEIESFGLIAATDGYYSSDDLTVMRAAGALLAFGIEPRHLRGFKAAADREIGLVQQVVTPLAKSKGDGAERAGEAAREIAALSVALHSALVRSGIQDLVR